MKIAIKIVANAIGAILVAPLVGWARLGVALGAEGPFCGGAQALALVPGIPGRVLRRAFYCLTLERCPWDVDVHFGAVVTHPTARFGRRVWIGLYSLIGECTVGDDVLIGSRVSVLSGRRTHRFDRADALISGQPGARRRVRIGRDCWFGEGAVVMADIGEGAVVGAAAVVVKPVEPFHIVAGNPARSIRDRRAGTRTERAADGS